MLLDDFLIRSLIGGIGIAILCGPLGCLVIWQRMSYFGLTLSHSSLLGVGLSFLLQWHIPLSILIVSVLISCLLIFIHHRSENLELDAVLGILAHSTLACGILVLTLIPTLRIDLMAYLFGDILTIRWTEIFWIYSGGLLGLCGLLPNIWNPLISLTVQRELAIVDGINEQKIRFIFLLTLSLIVAISIQIIGALLIVSLLIIPASAASKFAKSTEQMAAIASFIGVISICLGLWMSMKADSPAGPSIVVVESVLFFLSAFVIKIR